MVAASGKRVVIIADLWKSKRFEDALSKAFFERKLRKFSQIDNFNILYYLNKDDI